MGRKKSGKMMIPRKKGVDVPGTFRLAAQVVTGEKKVNLPFASLVGVARNKEERKEVNEIWDLYRDQSMYYDPAYMDPVVESLFLLNIAESEEQKEERAVRNIDERMKRLLEEEEEIVGEEGGVSGVVVMLVGLMVIFAVLSVMVMLGRVG